MTNPELNEHNLARRSRGSAFSLHGSSQRGSAVTGWGLALPDTVITNDDFAQHLDTSDEWITERTGIKERRWGGTTAGLGAEAARRALETAGVTADQLDLVILSTATSDQTVPATSAVIAKDLGYACGTFDLDAACAGFGYSFVVAHSMLATGLERVLVIGCDTLSGITDKEDRSTAVLFADGAAAVVLEAVPGEPCLLGWDLGVDTSAIHLLWCDKGGYIRMEGKETFRKAVRATIDSAVSALEQAKLTADDITLFVPHQANKRIIDAAADRLGIPEDRRAIVLDRTGNTSSASIPLALVDAANAGRLSDGDHVLIAGFGAGMTWASAVIRWGRP